MRQYKELVQRILGEGVLKEDRTGTGTLSVFGHQMRFNLSVGFPLVTLKKTHMKSIIHELLWFIAGDTRVQTLRDNGVTIWDEWEKYDGTIGPGYGRQWRSWPSKWGDEKDQLAMVIDAIQSTPHSRRLLVSAWNVADIDDMAIPPCHVLFQFYVADGRLSCQLYQRSADVFLGVPFNIASYALLTHLIAHQCKLDVGEFIWTGGDCHLYNNHMAQTTVMMRRQPRALPKLEILRDPGTSVFDIKYEDIKVVGYDPHPAIKAPVAV